MSTEFFNDQWRIPSNENQNKVSNYSMDLDGSVDYVQIGPYPNNVFLQPSEAELNATGYSVSAWIKIDSSFASIGGIFANDGIPQTGKVWGIEFKINSDRTLRIDKGDGTGRFGADIRRVITTETVPLNAWTHVAFVLPSATNTTWQIYINGVASTLSTGGSGGAVAYSSIYYGGIGRFRFEYFQGKINQVSIFDYGLSATEVSTLYGGGTAVTNPMTLSPIAYYQLGDQSVDNGANLLVPNNSLSGSEGYSPYALSFDGTNQEFDIPSVSTLELYNTDFTISFWCKVDANVTNPMFFEKYAGGGGWALYVFNDILRFYNGSAWTYVSGAFQTVYAGLWTNVTIVGDLASTNLKCYINGSQVHSSTNSLIQIQNTNILTMAGSNGNAFSYAGELSNVAIWSGTALNAAQVTEVYNQGVPTNLNTFSGNKPNHWWQLGSNSSFNSNSWTCLDEGISASTNPLTSAVSTTNMSNDDIVDGVGYSASGLGTSSIDIKGDAPYSTANGLSENMDVLDRTTDVPS